MVLSSKMTLGKFQPTSHQLDRHKRSHDSINALLCFAGRWVYYIITHHHDDIEEEFEDTDNNDTEHFECVIILVMQPQQRILVHLIINGLLINQNTDILVQRSNNSLICHCTPIEKTTIMTKIIMSIIIPTSFEEGGFCSISLSICTVIKVISVV